jgi:hypothetical protein
MTAPTLDTLKWYIITPQAATNYYPNPRFDGPDYGEDLTDYGASYSSAETAAHQRRGAYGIDVTTATSTEGGVYYNFGTIPDTVSRTFSADVKGTDGEAFSITIRNSGGTALATTTFTATGYWNRQSVTYTNGTGGDLANCRAYVSRLSSVDSANHFYTDGWQIEAGTEATTFIHGYGGDGYSWSGSPRNSNSTRNNKTGMGGSLLDIEDYCKAIVTVGLGMGNYRQIMTPMASGGSLYQQAITEARNFSIIVTYTGRTPGELHESRNAILDAVRPDRLPGKTMKIRYQGFSSDDEEATNPVDIICIPQPSHQDIPDNPLFQKAILSFTIPSGMLRGAFAEGGELDVNQSLSVEYIVSLDDDGDWSAMNGGLTGTLYAMVEAPNGDIVVGGDFTDAGGDTSADYIAKWNGSAFVNVTGAADFAAEVRALCYSPAGDLYIGGAFTDAGDADGDGIVKWDGSALSSLGTGADDNSVRAIAIEPNTGDVYVGGTFTGMGGVANTDYIAYYDVSADAWKALGTGIGATAITGIYTLAFARNGDLYIGGDFANASGTAGDYLCYWDGSAFNMVGSTELNGIVHDIEFGFNGTLYVGGAFTNAGGIADADYAARYYNNNWSALAAGLNDVVYDLDYDRSTGQVYIAGAFLESNSYVFADRIAVFDGNRINKYDIMLPGSEPVYKVLLGTDDTVYFGGNFSTTTEDPDEDAVTSKVAVNVTDNSGSANAYPYIQITGPGQLQSIVNYTTGKSIRFNDLFLLPGETLDLVLNPTNISVTSSFRGSAMSYVMGGSAIADFYLAPGTNYISLLIPAGSTADTGGWLFWNPLYWSIEGAKHE